MTSLGVGIHDVPRKHYDEIEAVNFSTLKHLGRSPAHYLHALQHPQEDTDALILGRAIHIAVFEPARFKATHVRWEGGRRQGKEWEAFKSEFRSRTILRDEDYKHCLDIAEAARRDATARRYLTGGRGEVTMIWDHERPALETLPGWSIGCKGRVDFLSEAEAICDLKSTRDASPVAFGRQVWNLGYYVQAAWYVDGHEAATGRRWPFVVVAVEKSPPHIGQVYRLTDEQLELGRQTYRAWLDQLRICREESRYPGYADGELDLELPRWAMPQDETIDDLDLEFEEKDEGNEGKDGNDDGGLGF